MARNPPADMAEHHLVSARDDHEGYNHVGIRSFAITSLFPRSDRPALPEGNTLRKGALPCAFPSSTPLRSALTKAERC